MGHRLADALQTLLLRRAHALEFADKSSAWVCAHLAKPGLQTWLELNGTPCIDTSEALQKKTICTSRSFGEMVKDLDALKSSVASFAASCANKLRGQRSAAGMVTVFVMSNRFREDLPQYANSASVPMLVPTSDTLEITQTALRALESIWRKGILYKKSGVVVSNIVPVEGIQGNLFDPVPNRPQRAKLMRGNGQLEPPLRAENPPAGSRGRNLSAVEGKVRTPKRKLHDQRQRTSDGQGLNALCSIPSRVYTTKDCLPKRASF